MLNILLRNTLINSIRNDLISVQEDVKIVTKKTDFNKIEIITLFEEDTNCSICLEPMTTDILRVNGCVNVVINVQFVKLRFQMVYL